MIGRVGKVHFPEIIHEVAASEVPHEIREKMAPRRGCHMDVYEVSFILVEVDPIRWHHSFTDITTFDLRHIDILAEIPLFPFDIDSHIRMVVHVVCLRPEERREIHSRPDKHEYRDDMEKYFFHTKMEKEWDLFDGLDHDFETGNRSPDDEGEFRLENIEASQSHHEDATDRKKWSLTEACIHRRGGHFTTVVYFFYKENQKWEKAKSRQKYRTSHEGKSNFEVIFRIHVEQEQRDTRATREKNNKKNKKIWPKTHDFWGKIWPKKEIGIDSC